MPVIYISDGRSPRADVQLSDDIPRSAVVWAHCPSCGNRYVRKVRGQPGRPANYCSDVCKTYMFVRRRLARTMSQMRVMTPEHAEEEARILRALAEVPVGGEIPAEE